MIHKLLEFEEGYREHPYYCSENFPTIGIGQRIGPKGADLSWYQFTCSHRTAYAWLSETIYDLEEDLNKFDWFNSLNSDRKTIIISMAYQLGVEGLLKFRKMIAAIENKDWNEVGRQALDSKWAKQTPSRSERHAAVLTHGNLMQVYEGLI